MYDQCVFFAEKVSAHKGARLAGTVLAMVAVNPERNGESFAVVGVPRGQRNAVPSKTWATYDYLSRKCVKVSEAQARAIHPELFRALEAFDASPEYRTGHAIEVAAAIVRGAYTLQPADAAIIARLPLGRTRELPDPDGWTVG
jgi:hypothetical protein